MRNQLIRCLVIFAVLYTPIAAQFNQISELKNRLTQQLLKPMEEQFSEISNALNTPKNIGQSYLTEFKGSLTGKLNDVEKLVNKVNEEYSSSGKDISECVKAHLNDIKSLPETFIEPASKCIDERVVEGVDVMNTVLANVNETQTSTKQYFSKIDECQSSSASNQVACIEALTEELEMDGSTIVGGIRAAGVTVKDYLKSFKTTLDLCTLGQVSNFFMEANNIAGNIVNCSVTKYNTTSGIWERAYRQPVKASGAESVMACFIGMIHFIVVLCIFAFQYVM